jgi:hypothetical protein
MIIMIIIDQITLIVPRTSNIKIINTLDEPCTAGRLLGRGQR